MIRMRNKESEFKTISTMVWFWSVNSMVVIEMEYALELIIQETRKKEIN